MGALQNDLCYGDIIAEDLITQGYSVQHNLLSPSVCEALYRAATAVPGHQLAQATVGQDKQRHTSIRRDRILWLDHTHPQFSSYLDWMAQTKLLLARRLMIALTDFECHLARYGAGDYYQKHKDAFRNDDSRLITSVFYLNPDWHDDDGGELLMYDESGKEVLLKLAPTMGTHIFFMSARFPHEVLPAKRNRYSLTTWIKQPGLTLV
jgi:SM-20-related protein